MSEQCKARFKAASRNRFTDEEVEAYVDKIRRRRAQSADADEVQSIRDILSGLTRDEVYEFARRKILAAHELRANGELKMMWSGISARSETQRLKTFLVGQNADVAGGHRGLDQISRSLGNGRKRDMVNDLKAAGLWERVEMKILPRKGDSFDDDLFIELARVNGSPDAPTGNADAVRAAQIMAPHIEGVRTGMNRYGAGIGKIDGYVTPQHHDALKLAGGFFQGLGQDRRKAAQAAWKAEIRPRLDPITFEGVDDIDQFLDQVWSNIVSGNHQKTTGQSLDGALAHVAPPVGQSALANRVNQQRVLHFKTAKDALEYRKSFGEGTTISSVLEHIDRGAKNETLLKYMGPNPEAKFETLQKHVHDKADSFDQVSSVLKPKARRAEFDELTGAVNAGANVRFSSFTSALKTWQVVTKLGGMVLSSASDVPLAASTLMRAGVPAFDAYGAAFSGIFRIGNRAERAEVAETLGVAINVVSGSGVSRYALSDGAGGLLQRTQQRFYKLNLFDTYQKGLRSGVGYVYARQIARQSHLRFDQLNGNMQKTFAAYGVDRDLWDAVRAHVSPVRDGGQPVLTPDMMRDASPVAVEKWAQANGYGDADAARREMALRLDMMFMDLADRALTEPKAGERAMLRLGSGGGNMAKAVSVLMQFKSFPATVLTQHILPSMRGENGKLRPSAQTAHLIAATWVMGYFAMQAKQMAAGKTPLPMNEDTLMKAFLQGGGAGIFGDFLFADYNSYGNSLAGTALGPSVGTFESFMQVSQALFTEDKAKVRALNFARSNVPFGNLFYTRLATDYLVWFQLKELVEPGTLRKMEKRLEGRTGQTYFTPPSEAVQ